MRPRLVPLLLLALAVQIGVTSDLRLLGAVAEPLLLVAAAVGVLGGGQKGAAAGFTAGLLADLLLHTPFGLAALVFTIVGFMAGQMADLIVRAAWWLPVLTCAVASGAGVLLFAVTGATLGFTHFVSPDLLRIVPVVAVLNGLLAIGVVPAVRWALVEPGLARSPVG